MSELNQSKKNNWKGYLSEEIKNKIVQEIEENNYSFREKSGGIITPTSLWLSKQKLKKL